MAVDSNCASEDRIREILGRIQLAAEAQLDWIRTAVGPERTPEEVGLCLFEQAEAQRELQSALLDYMRVIRARDEVERLPTEDAA